MVLLKHHSDQRYSLPCSDSGWWRRMRADIMGVRVSDTKAEKMMVTASVTANSRNRRPTISAMNSSGMSTAMSETVNDTMVNPISADPVKAAFMAESPRSM